jgi:hypothetical protein
MRLLPSPVKPYEIAVKPHGRNGRLRNGHIALDPVPRGITLSAESVSAESHAMRDGVCDETMAGVK